ncbi:putative ATP synthase mitochondrial F1 complex assembly factor 1 [Hypsibius exemplaris]|uniref:ATP synthase mitochondrial F1 complex assembly factor 1 n=1 Tax=Hypsibius exemplaris TaxID=2072580 RepID=A0A1W0WWW0_HYPEX|nr:putative ATP synthase mitochondrial F1 complex assembly factor 1 [Hypsibius exemplaris]
MEELKKNPFFDKYAERLAQLQKQNPEKFLKMAEDIKAKNELAAAADQSTEAPPVAKVPVNVKPVYNKQRQLSDVMKVDLLAGRPVQEVAELWAAYHKLRDGFVAAIVPTAMYDTITARSNRFPVFLYPLPRSGGYEFFVAEFQGRECFFTQLAQYQTRQADSPPCLSVIHFEEFRSDGAVLMRGEYDEKVLNAAEVQCLLNQMQLYYGTEDAAKIRLVEAFNHSPATFQHTDLIAEVEHSFASLKAAN